MTMHRSVLPVAVSGAIALFIIAAGTVGCSAGPADESGRGTWQAVRDTVGDTIVVRTESGSAWGEPGRLVEEVAIGVLDGLEELMFGSVQEIAPDEGGGVYVFDGQVPALRYYDASGDYVRTLGGQGGGPGEYQDAALGLAIRSDGRLVMRDPRNARLNVYDPDGTPSDHWSVASGLFTADAMVLDTADHVYLKILTERTEPNSPWKIGLLHLDAGGEPIDTVPDPVIDGEPTGAGGTFLPDKEWAFNPLRDMIVGVSSSYAFEIRRADGRVVRVEKAFEPVDVHPEERAEYEARNEWIRRNQGQFLTSEIPPVPDTKAAYRGIYAGERGRIWVRRHMAAEKVEEPEDDPDPNRPPPITWPEPTVFDVFDRDGRYLGEVRPPPRTNLVVMRGDTVWAIRRGELDEQYVVRFRLEHDGAPATE